MIKLDEVFEKHEAEFLKFDRIEVKRSKRPDLHAFLLLDEIVPGSHDIVEGADHDEIYLETDLNELSKRATEEQIVELIRCGVRYGEYDSLSMYV